MGVPIRLAGVIRESVVDGPGWRLVVFGQGCPHHCKGCQNPQTHDFDGGYTSNTDNIVEAVKQNPLLAGVTFSGGDPFVQAKEFAQLGKDIHALGLNVITFSGYTIEQLMAGMDKHEGWKELLEQTDVLIDGKFILEQKSLNLRFRGSKNQRAIDPKASIEQGKAVEVEI